MRLPPQIVRLLLLTVVIVAGFLAARFFLTPPSFGEFGYYRGDALGEAASLPIAYAGQKACEECHSEQHEIIMRAEHKTLSCESCHGAGAAHVDNPDVPLAKLTFSHCLRCHEASPGRPLWFKQIKSKEHYTGHRCTECHSPHEPNETP
jgi:ribosomal protein L37AE/L43A